MRKSIISLVALTLLLGACSSGFEVETKTSIILEYGDELTLENVTDDTTVELKDVKDLDSKKIGVQSPTIIFSKDDKEVEVKVDVDVKDTKLPEITLASIEVTITEGDEFDPQSNIESVKDPVDGDIASSDAEDLASNGYKVTGDYDLATPGTYDLLITAYDLNSNIAERTFKLIVNAQEIAVVTPPSITTNEASKQSSQSPSPTPPVAEKPTEQPSVTPPKEPDKVLACPNGGYDKTKPCNWIPDYISGGVKYFYDIDEAHAYGNKYITDHTEYGFNTLYDYDNGGTRVYIIELWLAEY